MERSTPMESPVQAARVMQVTIKRTCTDHRGHTDRSSSHVYRATYFFRSPAETCALGERVTRISNHSQIAEAIRQIIERACGIHPCFLNAGNGHVDEFPPKMFVRRRWPNSVMTYKLSIELWRPFPFQPHMSMHPEQQNTETVAHTAAVTTSQRSEVTGASISRSRCPGCTVNLRYCEHAPCTRIMRVIR